GRAHLRERDRDGMTDLHWAVVGNRLAAVRALLAGGADVSPVDRFPPLFYAATLDFGDAETATALLQAGANPNVKNHDGRTALAQASEYPYVRAVLEGAGAR